MVLQLYKVSRLNTELDIYPTFIFHYLLFSKKGTDLLKSKVSPSQYYKTF